MGATLGQEIHWIKGIDPVADGFSGTVYTDVFEAAGLGAMFLVYVGVNTGGTGSSTLTVQACSNTTPSARTALPFYYRTSTTGDTWGDWTAATTSGFATTAGSSQMYEIRVPADVIATSGYKYVQLKAVEAVDDPVVVSVLCGVYGLRFAEQPESLID
jgi:hypothetical protein